MYRYLFSLEEPNKDLEVAMSLYRSLAPASPWLGCVQHNEVLGQL